MDNHVLWGLIHSFAELSVCVLLASCVRMCSLLWVPFILVVCFYSFISLPFTGDGTYMIMYGW